MFHGARLANAAHEQPFDPPRQLIHSVILNEAKNPITNAPLATKKTKNFKIKSQNYNAKLKTKTAICLPISCFCFDL
jgi:hypothetical protein